MYEVSAAYLTAHKSPVHQKKIRGTVGFSNITGDNIVSGSLMIHNQCSDSPDIKLGAVYIGTLECTFANVSGIGRYSWKGNTVFLEEGLRVSYSSYEYVPKGIWTITEAEWNKDGVSVKAYDNMRKFDKPFTYTQIEASLPIDILEMLCTDCNVQCGMEDLDDFCNGNSVLIMTDPGDIETYQDALYWLAQALCAFATIDRNGKLVLRRFVSDPVDTVQSRQRYNESSFSDYETRYTGVSVVNMSDNTTKYYPATVDDGSTINLGANPFLQSLTRDTLMQNILNEIQQIRYVPFSASMLDGAFYDLGDVIQQRDGLAGTSSNCIIMYFDDAYNSRFDMKSFGADPGLSSAKSKSDKKIQGLVDSVDKNEYRDYESRNAKKITILDTHEERILTTKLASNRSTKALIHLEINLECIANAISDEIEIGIDEDYYDSEERLATDVSANGDGFFRLVSNKTTKGIVRYLINSEEAAFKPVEQWLDGNHVLHLMYVLGLEQGIPVQFDVYLEAEGGNIEIPKGGFWFYASGRGLVGDGKWDGNLILEDDASDFNLIELVFENVTDEVTIQSQNPVDIPITEIADDFALITLTFESASGVLLITTHTDSRQILTEDDYIITTEDGKPIYTEGE